MTEAKKPAAKKVASKKKPATKKAAAKKKPATKKAASKKKPAAKQAPVKKRFESLAEVRVLVVDDEPDILELVVPVLEQAGYSVDEAPDGDTALETILVERPHIVVLDVMMPGLNGWEVARYVRERPELSEVRIIMATGIGPETNAATSPLYGADAYLDKPFDLSSLRREVAALVERFEAGEFA